MSIISAATTQRNGSHMKNIFALVLLVSIVGFAQVTSFNTRTGAVTLNSSDVTTALGYTPISNITGYITAGTNITLSGSGTSSSPYLINANAYSSYIQGTLPTCINPGGLFGGNGTCNSTSDSRNGWNNDKQFSLSINQTTYGPSYDVADPGGNGRNASSLSMYSNYYARGVTQLFWWVCLRK